MNHQDLLTNYAENHPMKNEKEAYSLFSEIGNLISCKKDRDIPDLMKEIGMGPSLQLLLLRNLACLFLILSILHIPIMVIFYNGTQKYFEYGSFNHSFLALTQGNLG